MRKLVVTVIVATVLALGGWWLVTPHDDPVSAELVCADYVAGVVTGDIEFWDWQNIEKVRRPSGDWAVHSGFTVPETGETVEYLCTAELDGGEWWVTIDSNSSSNSWDRELHEAGFTG